jgi:hypothetical protein
MLPDEGAGDSLPARRQVHPDQNKLASKTSSLCVVGGTQTLVLSLQPVVRIGRASLGYGSYVSNETTNIASYVIRARVKVPLSQRVPEMMSSVAATFRVAHGYVEAATGLIAAIIAFGAAIGIKRLRQKRAGKPVSDTGEPLPAK